MKQQKYVAYLRVSTQKQAMSGLGLDAQRHDVSSFIRQRSGVLIREFIEIESGKRAERRFLNEALSLAQRSRATLLVAKLDRLSRNVAFLAVLMESNVDFCACDMPSANKLTLHIMGAMAEFEREMISKRTKAAMREAKAKGAVFGSARPGHWEGIEERRREGGKLGASRAGEVHRRQAESAYRDVAPLINQLRAEGLSLRAIAQKLNDEAIPTRRGKLWRATTVRNVLKRFNLNESQADVAQVSPGIKDD